jgi:phosphoribosylformylglycinamidine synthase
MDWAQGRLVELAGVVRLEAGCWSRERKRRERDGLVRIGASYPRSAAAARVSRTMKRGRGALLKYYRTNVDDHTASAALAKSLAAASVELVSLKQEHCYNVQLSDDAAALSSVEAEHLLWLFAETFEPEKTVTASFFPADGCVLEIGPRLSFETAFSSNAVSICTACGLTQVVRVECSKRFLVETKPPLAPAALARDHARALHDPMTECVYLEPLASFEPEGGESVAKPTVTIRVCSEGRKALEKASEEMGLGFDATDLDLYTKLFAEHLGRDPTDVECFDMGQSKYRHAQPLNPATENRHAERTENRHAGL